MLLFQWRLNTQIFTNLFLLTLTFLLAFLSHLFEIRNIFERWHFWDISVTIHEIKKIKCSMSQSVTIWQNLNFAPYFGLGNGPMISNTDIPWLFYSNCGRGLLNLTSNNVYGFNRYNRYNDKLLVLATKFSWWGQVKTFSFSAVGIVICFFPQQL